MFTPWKKNLASVQRAVASVGARPLVRVLGGAKGLAASVIIATRNKATYLDLTLAALERQSLPAGAWEAVVTDDASLDDTSRVLDKYEKRKHLRLAWRRSSRCRGRSGARNDALELAQGRIIIFLDDDRIVESDFLLRHLMHHVDEACVVHGDIHRRIHTHVSPIMDPRMWNLARLLRRDGSLPPDKTFPQRILEPEDLAFPERLRPLMLPFSPEFRTAVEGLMKCGLPWFLITTGNASAPRDQVMAVRGFDEGYLGWGLEDTDLFLRLAMTGLPFHFEPEAYTLHQIHPKDVTKAADFERNLRHFFDKHSHLDRKEMEPLIRQSVSPEQWIQQQQERAQKRAEPLVKHPGSCRSVLWCVSGGGLQPVQRDIVLAHDLRKACPGVQIRFLSYGSAARWLRDRGFDTEDMGAGAGGSPRLRFERFTRRISESPPDLVVSDEDLLALPIARAAGIPAVYLTSRLLEESQNPDYGYAHCARKVLFADLPGSFPAPPGLEGRVEFCGPWVADAGSPQEDWSTLLDAGEHPLVVIAVDEGSPANTTFLQNCVAAALSQSSSPRVMVLAGTPARVDAVASLLPKATLLVDSVPNPAGLFRAADLVISRGEHTMLWQLAAAGVPAIAVPPPQEQAPFLTDYARRMAKLGSCLYVPEAIATPENLKEAIDQVLATPLGAAVKEAGKGIDFAARRKEAVAHLMSVAGGE